MFDAIGLNSTRARVELINIPQGDYANRFASLGHDRIENSKLPRPSEEMTFSLTSF